MALDAVTSVQQELMTVAPLMEKKNATNIITETIVTNTANHHTSTPVQMMEAKDVASIIMA